MRWARAPAWLRAALLVCLVVSRAAAAQSGSSWSEDDEDDPETLQELEYGEGEGEDADGEGEADEDVQGAEVNVELTQYDYADACSAIGDARWQWLLQGEPAKGESVDALWSSQALLAAKARDNIGFMRQFASLGDRPAAPEALVDQVHYALHAGDLLLPADEYAQKLNYSFAVQRALGEVEVPCGGSEPADCTMTLPVVRRVLARSGDPAQQLRAWSGALAALQPFARAFPRQLLLARAAAARNAIQAPEGPDDGGPPAPGDAVVEAYWRELQDPDNYLSLSFGRVRSLWAQLKPFHRRLVGFVRKRLHAVYGDAALAVAGAPTTPTPTPTAANATEEQPLPAHLLGSLEGDDWSALADLIIPGESIRSLDRNFEKKGLRGQALWSSALDTLEALGMEDLPRQAILARVRTDGQCPPPPRIAVNCSGGPDRVMTCASAGWQQWVEAHEAVARVVHTALGAEEDKKALLRVLTRHSVLHDALPLLVRVVSLHPERLEDVDVLPEAEDGGNESSEDNEDDEDSGDDGSDGWAALRLATALRVIPRLAFLAAVDHFRLRLLHASASDSLSANASANATDPAALWQQVRREFMLVAAPAGASEADAGWLAVPEAAANEPLLGRFAGELLAFQALEYLASYDRDRPFYSIREQSDLSIADLMKLGRSRRWPDILNDFLDINEIRAEPLLRYLRPVERLLAKAAASEARDAAAAARSVVDLSPPTLPAETPSPSAPAPPSDAAPAAAPAAPPSAPAAAPSDDAAPAAASSPTANAPASAPDDVGATLRAGSEHITSRDAVLGASLGIFVAALLAGVAVGARKLLRRRAYTRNRRPGAPPTSNGSLPSAPTLPEDSEDGSSGDPEAQPVNKGSEDLDEDEATAETPVTVTAAA